MKLVTYGPVGAELPGVLINEEVVPLLPALTEAGLQGLPANAMLALWPALQEVVQSAVQRGRARYPIVTVRLGAPVLNPGKIIGVGLNYRGYVSQVFDPNSLPVDPVLFLKPASSLCGAFDPIVTPPESADVEPELEIAVVIGKAGNRIPVEQAMDHVFGFMAANDVTARDVFIGESAKSPLFLQAARGKGFIGFCPTGPWLLTRDEVTDLSAFELNLTVNGDVRQSGRSDSMICDIPSLVAAASCAFGLMPGDILLTGSPPRQRRTDGGPTSLKAGDEVRALISLLGEMVNPIARETQ